MMFMKRFINSSLYLPTIHSIRDSLAQNLHPQALRSSLSLSSPSFTDQTYALFLKSGHVLDAYLTTHLITHFSKCGDFSRSLQFLLDTQHPDIISFNALLSGYAQFHHSFASFSLYNNLACSGLRPNSYTLSSLIKSCGNAEEIMAAHVICVKLGLNLSSFLASGLVGKYAKCGSLESAEKCFEECLVLDEVVWTAMLSGYVWNGEFEKGREVFVGMRGIGLELNEFILTSVLGALWDVKEGEQIHGFAVKMGLLGSSSNYLRNAVVSLYSRCGKRFEAVKLFDEITEPDVVSWTVRITAACDGEEAFAMFKLVHSSNLGPNELTLINLLSAIEHPKLLKPGRQVHLLCYKTGYLLVVSVGNALISMYGKCGEMGDARQVFDEVIYRDSVSWNSLIGGYGSNGLIRSALEIFSQMRHSYVEPDRYTVASILEAVSNSRFSKPVMQIHSYMIIIGFASDNSMISCLISSYAKCNSMEDAKKVFAESVEMNAGNLHVISSAAVNAGCPTEALELFNYSRRSFFELDCVTLSIVLKACSALTNLGQGRAIHSLALKSGFNSDSFVESAVVDFYCKCGCIADAKNAFGDISRGNLAAWNAMVMGYAQHGCYSEVLELFEKMVEVGLKPDEITYLGILNSCCHAGLVNEAHVHLHNMFELHGVVPCLGHYTCIIDLLGRIGLVEEAKRTIDQMPVSPDAQIWQSLLSACNTYGNLDVGKVAARELLRLQPENDSAYILLSSLYARTGDWGVAGRLRRELKERVICKEPGYSWTEVGGYMHHFLAGDHSHPESEKIYLCLWVLTEQMLPQSDTDEEDRFYVSDV
ncbi:hypothetical protein Ancab_023377 [Ancistrocladus abbreviatus]